ncbi:MAG TPA: xyloglucanase [Tepidisphaeraceae bacterium]|nr:xyloglucanase [Tepidisphaeraceae bacterium]
MRLIACCCFWLLIGLLAPARAQQVASAPYEWKNVKVVAGGYVPGVVFSRVARGLAYCRTDIGGCYRWDEAQQRWLPLMDSIGTSSYFGGESIAPDPVDANIVYVAAGMYSTEDAAILRSGNRGDTWDVIPVPFRMGGNEDGRGMGERLAVDPNDNRVLYFGSRHDGLWTSGDSASTWQKVQSFPLPGLGNPSPARVAHAGLSFVVFDRTSGARGSRSRTIFVGSADPGEQHLFRSDDAGQSWHAVEGGPNRRMLPAKAEMDDAGQLYVTFGTSIGPNDVADGAVWKLDVRAGQWTDITPIKSPDRSAGGYCGLSIDRQHRGTVAVTTIDRWHDGDTIFRSEDGGATWVDALAHSQRDISLSPYLLWGKGESRPGWWMSALAIDPFNSDHAAYATGATIYGTGEFTRADGARTTRWNVWADGMEETAVLALISPPSGAPLVSGFGDLCGFAHHDLSASPADGMFTNPLLSTVTQVEYAGAQPAVIVRRGSPDDRGRSIGFSEDGGATWHPLLAPRTSSGDDGRRRHGGAMSVIVGADGQTLVFTTSAGPSITRDRGGDWNASNGLPPGARPVADRVDPMRFYAIDFKSASFYISADGAATFTKLISQGLPGDLTQERAGGGDGNWPLQATPGRAGDLWFVSRRGLFHSQDGGGTFVNVRGGIDVEFLSFGKAPAGRDEPELFAIGTAGLLRAIWRSDDSGASWLRVNDDRHQYGTRFRCITGDPRVFGRVYVGTDGRGIVYGDATAH